MPRYIVRAIGLSVRHPRDLVWPNINARPVDCADIEHHKDSSSGNLASAVTPVRRPLRENLA
jgi:hypothetical protein